MTFLKTIDILRKEREEYKKQLSIFKFGVVGLMFILLYKITKSNFGCFKEGEFLIFGGLFIICLIMMGIYKYLDFMAIAKIKKLQEIFYEKLSTDNYRSVLVTFSSKQNDGIVYAFYEHASFYAKRKPNDIIAIMAESATGIVFEKDFAKEDIEIDDVYYREWLPSEVTDEEEQPEKTE